jgi:hypothetical protein
MRLSTVIMIDCIAATRRRTSQPVLVCTEPLCRRRATSVAADGGVHDVVMRQAVVVTAGSDSMLRFWNLKQQAHS